MKTDAEMPWPATADEHDDLKNLILEIKHKKDRIIQLLIAVIVVEFAVILTILLILIFVQ
ncbi:MAG: hypothetical protein WCG09_06520 [Halobacteriota archaeon]|jgi:hypothetical protein